MDTIIGDLIIIQITQHGAVPTGYEHIFEMMVKCTEIQIRLIMLGDGMKYQIKLNSDHVGNDGMCQRQKNGLTCLSHDVI